jgi:hypothetical protein
MVTMNGINHATDGYKVNIAGIYAWFMRTRPRIVAYACLMFALGAWFTLTAMRG